MENQEVNKYKGKGALDAFLNLFNLITLGWLAISFGGVMFWIISKFFSPEINNYAYQASQSQLKFNIASLIIITPIFLLIAGSLHKKYKNGELNPQSGVYRWLTYLMLLISGLNIIGSLIAVVFRLLDGDYTLAFMLKVLTILVIASGIFGYYWYDLKRNDYAVKSNISLYAVIAIIIVVLASIIGSLFLVDSPAESRMRAYDRQRSNDLTSLNANIMNYYSAHGELPMNLLDDRFSRFKDPETKAPYGYNKLDEETFEICATFSRESLNESNNRYYYDEAAEWYFHGAGYQCFQRGVEGKDTIIVPLETPPPPPVK